MVDAAHISTSWPIHRAGWLRTQRCRVCPIRRARELAEVARRFSDDLDLNATLDRVAQEVAELFGGSCLVRVRLEGEQEPDRSVLRHASLTAMALTRSVCGGCPDQDELLCRRLSRLDLTKDTSQPGPPSLETVRSPTALSASRCFGQGTLAAPMVARDRVIGLLAVVRHTPGAAFNDADRNFLTDLAGHAALAIDTACRYETALSYTHDLQLAAQEREQEIAELIHDMKNPLAIIYAAGPLLRKRVAALDGVEVAGLNRMIDYLEMAAARLTAQVSAVATIPLIEEARAGHEQSLFDLVAVARTLAEIHQHSNEQHCLLVRSELPELVGRWSRPEIESLIDNLLVNALKYSPAGGEILLALGREDGPEGAAAVLTISDQGIGIPADELPRVFQRRYRAGNVGTIPGSGLGLSRARQIVERHSGTINLRSTPGAGTVVMVRLPIRMKDEG